MKSISKLSAGLIAVLTIIAPQTVMAVDTTTTDASGICTKLSATKTKIVDRVNNRESALKTKTDARLKSITESRKKVDGTVATNQEQADTNRQEHFDKLLAAATTENQKAAVAEFQKAIEKAVSDRRAANKAARDTFRTGLDSVLSTQKSKVDAAKTVLLSSVDTAIAKAQASCDAGDKKPQIRETLKSELQTAMDTFKNSMGTVGDVSVQVKALVTARQKAFDAAKTAFQAAKDAAKEAFKAAIKQ